MWAGYPFSPPTNTMCCHWSQLCSLNLRSPVQMPPGRLHYNMSLPLHSALPLGRSLSLIKLIVPLASPLYQWSNFCLWSVVLDNLGSSRSLLSLLYFLTSLFFQQYFSDLLGVLTPTVSTINQMLIYLNNVFRALFSVSEPLSHLTTCRLLHSPICLEWLSLALLDRHQGPP